jgi:hypothetical protein
MPSTYEREPYSAGRYFMGGPESLVRYIIRARHTLPLYALTAANPDQPITAAQGLAAHRTNILSYFKDPLDSHDIRTCFSEKKNPSFPFREGDFHGQGDNIKKIITLLINST